MKRDFEYWENAYFYGWLGKLITIVFFLVITTIIIHNYIDPWVIETLCMYLG